MHLRCVAAHGLPRRNANVVLQSWSRLRHHIRDAFSCSIGCCRCVNDKKVNWQRTWPPHFADTAGIGCYSYCATSCGASSTWIVSNEVKCPPLYCILVVDEVCYGMLFIWLIYGLIIWKQDPLVILACVATATLMVGAPGPWAMPHGGTGLALLQGQEMKGDRCVSWIICIISYLKFMFVPIQDSWTLS